MTNTYKNEERLLKRLVTDALDAGFFCSVDDGGDHYAIEGSKDITAIMEALHNTDEDRLYFDNLQPTDPEETPMVGCVLLIYGNGNDGLDMISDYTLNIEDVVTGANELALKMERN